MEEIMSQLATPFELLQWIDEVKWTVDGTKTLMYCAQGECLRAPWMLLRHIAEICWIKEKNLRYWMINRIPPGVIVPVHKDHVHGERNLRYHLPLVTNDKAGYWDEVNGVMIMEQGSWYGPIPYWTDHNVWNKGDSERVHLIVDLEDKC
jgi:hypothetical protein